MNLMRMHLDKAKSIFYDKCGQNAESARLARKSVKRNAKKVMRLKRMAVQSEAKAEGD